jgi:hypothetical protein
LKKIKIFTSKNYLPKGHGYVEILYPFWGILPDNPPYRNTNRYENFVDIARKLFEIVDDPDDADIFLLPADLKKYYANDNFQQLNEIVDISNSFKKKILIFNHSDKNIPIYVKNAITFRTSIYKSQKRKQDNLLPAWPVDFLKKYNNSELIIRNKREKPVIGFCGNATPRYHKSGKRKLYDTIVRKFPKSPIFMRFEHNTWLRNRIIQSLSNSSEIHTNFEIMDGFFAGIKNSNEEWNENEIENARLNYYNNLIGSDYVLSVRGEGNYSFRFYETLCCGRIPIFIDTDTILPFEKWINWNDHCLKIKYSEINKIAEKVRKFHNKISNEGFHKMQIINRELWEKWLSPEGFFSNLFRHID